MRHFLLCFIAIFVFFILAQVGPAQAEEAAASEPLIAVASSLRFVMEPLIEASERRIAVRPRPVFASSGTLSRQIIQGAPYELFLSADADGVTRVVTAGRGLDEGRVYAQGRLSVLISEPSSPSLTDNDGGPAGLLKAAAGKIAIANPAHAPYGRAAMEFLVSVGLWETVKPRLVIGENVAQAAQFTVSRSAQLGVVSRSLALSLSQRGGIRFVDVPMWTSVGETAPLSHWMVLMSGSGAPARRFYDFMVSPAAQEILAQHGFHAPRSGP